MRFVVVLLLLLFLSACNQKSKEEPAQPVVKERKQTPADDLDVLKDDPSVPAGGLRTIEETREIQKTHDEKVKEHEEVLNDTE